MDQVQQEPTFEESVKQVMHTLPLLIRNYLGQGKYSDVANRLMTKYALHVDQGSILEREIMLLLMGIDNPDEFVQALAEEAMLDQQTVTGITQDVNEQIFVPLREEMRRGEKVEEAAKVAAALPPRPMVLPPLSTIIPANPQLPVKPPQVNASVPRYAPPKKYFNLQNKIPPPAKPTQPPPQKVVPPPPPKPMGSSRLLEDHEEPHIELHAGPSPAAESPLRQALRTVMPRPVEASDIAGPPPNLPGVILPPPPIPRPPVVSPPKQKPPIPITHYSSDPYREPIEP